MPDRKSIYKSEGFAFFLKLLAWLLLFSTIFILRSFFTLIFLTFVFSYLQSKAVNKLKSKIQNRKVRVFIVATYFLTILLLVGSLFIPLVLNQAKVITEKYPNYLNAIDKEIIKITEDSDLIKNALKTAEIDQNSPTTSIIQLAIETNSKEKNEEPLQWLIHIFKNLGANLLALGSAFFLSLLFSFLIILDLPRIKEGVFGLRKTRLQFIYQEVAPGISKFGEVLGQTLTAQLFIAIANTILTAISIYILGIGDKVAFLSIIVFFCSFIPVAGVFISSVPICLFALSASGLSNLVLAVALIFIVHIIEAYVLNPRIYSQHLKLNPVFVLIILTIAGKLFHAWGLILGLPICTYFFKHAIREEAQNKIID